MLHARMPNDLHPFLLSIHFHKGVEEIMNVTRPATLYLENAYKQYKKLYSEADPTTSSRKIGISCALV